MAAIKRADETDAGVDRFIFQLAIQQAANQHGAGAAVAFGATFLGAAQIAVKPQEIEQGLDRRHGREFDLAVIEQETDGATDLDGHGSAPAIGRIAVRRQQQRHVIVRRHVCDAEADGDDIEKCDLAIRLAEVIAGVETQLIGPGLHGIAAQKRCIATAIIVGAGRSDRNGALAVDAEEIDAQVLGGFAKRRVEHVGRQPAGCSQIAYVSPPEDCIHSATIRHSTSLQ